MALMITDDNFEKEVIQSDKPVLIDFYADWCGPCKMVGPIIEELATEREKQIKICKVNVDHAPEIARKYSVISIPSLVFIKNGEYVSKLIGAKPKSEIEEEIELFLK